MSIRDAHTERSIHEIMEYIEDVENARDKAERERDDARHAGKIAAEDRDWCRQVGMPQMAAEVERLRAIPVVPVGYRDIAQDVVRALNNAGQFGNDVVDTGRWWPGKAVRDLLAELERLRAELAEERSHVEELVEDAERFAAAQPKLPEVPVKRVGQYTVDVDGVDFDGTDTPDHYRREAARYLALAAFLEAEAAATDNDDEVDPEVAVIQQILARETGEDLDDVWSLASGIRSALDAHRARSAEGGVTA